MSRTDRTGRSKKAPKHVRLYWWLVESAAWNDLNGNERAAYIAMAHRYNGSNNGRIHMSANELVPILHVSKSTASRTLISLQDHGFIVAMKKGAFNLKDRTAQATEWRMTEFACDVTHALPSKDFTRWQPENISRSHYGTRNGTVVTP